MVGCLGLVGQGIWSRADLVAAAREAVTGGSYDLVVLDDVSLDLKAGEKLSVHREGRRIILEPTTRAQPRISYEEFRRRVPRYEGPTVAAEDMTSRVGDLFRDWKD